MTIAWRTNSRSGARETRRKRPSKCERADRMRGRRPRRDADANIGCGAIARVRLLTIAGVRCLRWRCRRASTPRKPRCSRAAEQRALIQQQALRTKLNESTVLVATSHPSTTYFGMASDMATLFSASDGVRIAARRQQRRRADVERPAVPARHRHGHRAEQRAHACQGERGAGRRAGAAHDLHHPALQRGGASPGRSRRGVDRRPARQADRRAGRRRHGAVHRRGSVRPAAVSASSW